MSIASIARERQSDQLLGRIKPESLKSDRVAPPPTRFSLADFIRQIVSANKPKPKDPKEREAARERNAYMQGRKQALREIITVPWRRDGFRSEAHYLAYCQPNAMRQALGDSSHPLHAKALEAKELKLL
jgi:hypothetical protein